MDLINKQVMHKSFGKGSIVECTGSYMEVRFLSGNKRFLYPDAFEKYLTMVDKRAADSIDKILNKLIMERKIKEDIIEKENAVKLEEEQRLSRMKKLLENHKIHSSSQVAFKCEKEESDRIFTEWRIFSGTIKSGKNQGKPNKLIRIHQNSACLITCKDAGKPEKDRYISGVFMVVENFIGRLCEDGYIPAHSEYRIKLSEQESKKMPFWKYYTNSRYPNNMTWNSGTYRYFDNIWMAQILKDIVSLKIDREEQKLSQEFLDYFCRTNQIEKNEIVEPDGTLLQKNL